VIICAIISLTDHPIEAVFAMFNDIGDVHTAPP